MISYLSILRSYLTSFLNRVYYEINDVFSSHSDDSLDRFMLPNDKTNQGGSTRNDQETNQLEKTIPIRGPCDSGDVGATSTIKESSTLIQKLRDHISLTIPIFKCLYLRHQKQFWITHRYMPHTDYTYPIEILEPTSKLEFYAMLNKNPFYVRNYARFQSIYNELGLFALKRRFSMDTWKTYFIPKTYLGGGIKSVYLTDRRAHV